MKNKSLYLAGVIMLALVLAWSFYFVNLWETIEAQRRQETVIAELKMDKKVLSDTMAEMTKMPWVYRDNDITEYHMGGTHFVRCEVIMEPEMMEE